MPDRVQRQRVKGWRMPEGAVYVGRPTKWGNPYTVSESMSPDEAVRQYRNYLINRNQSLIGEAQRELKGKDLACWCPLTSPCHADVLLHIANA